MWLRWRCDDRHLLTRVFHNRTGYTFWDKDSKQRLKLFKRAENSITCSGFNRDGSMFAYGLSYDWSKVNTHHGLAVIANIMNRVSKCTTRRSLTKSCCTVSNRKKLHRAESDAIAMNECGILRVCGGSVCGCLRLGVLALSTEELC